MKSKKTFSKKERYVDITISLRKDIYDELKVMARSEYRSINNQIKYLMSLGKDLITNSNGAIITRPADVNKEGEQLESAIGFKIGE